MNLEEIASDAQCWKYSMIKVVSLASDAERRRVFTASAETSQLWSFLDAHTSAHADLDVDVPRMRTVAGRELKRSEIGCYSSHYSAWKLFLDSDSKQLIVFEDDAMIDWTYIDFIAGQDLGALGVHYLKLFVKVPGRFRRIKSPFLDPYHHLVQYLGPAFGTQAYVLSRHGAAVLVDKLRRVSLAVDHAMDCSWEHGLPTLAIFPSPVIERFIPSTIGDARFTPDSATRMEQFRTHALVRLEQVRRLTLGFAPKPRISAGPQ